MSELADYAERLRAAAARLRDEELDDEQAAALVDECARLAVAAGGELDRLAREANRSV